MEVVATMSLLHHLSEDGTLVTKVESCVCDVPVGLKGVMDVGAVVESVKDLKASASVVFRHQCLQVVQDFLMLMCVQPVSSPIRSLVDPHIVEVDAPVGVPVVVSYDSDGATTWASDGHADQPSGSAGAVAVAAAEDGLALVGPLGWCGHGLLTRRGHIRIAGR